MSDDDVRKTIKDIENEIFYYCRIYRDHKNQLSQLDAHIMSLYKTKWAIERKLIKVTKVPTYIGKPKAKKVKEVILDYEDMTIDQLSKLLDDCQTMRNSGHFSADSGYSNEDEDDNDDYEEA